MSVVNRWMSEVVLICFIILLRASLQRFGRHNGRYICQMEICIGNEILIDKVLSFILLSCYEAGLDLLGFWNFYLLYDHETI